MRQDFLGLSRIGVWYTSWWRTSLSLVPRIDHQRMWCVGGCLSAASVAFGYLVCKSSRCGFCQYEHANQLSSIQSIAGFLQFDGRDEVAKTSSFVSSPPCGGRLLGDGGRPGLLSLLTSTYSLQVKLISICLTFPVRKRKKLCCLLQNWPYYPECLKVPRSRTPMFQSRG